MAVVMAQVPMEVEATGRVPKAPVTVVAEVRSKSCSPDSGTNCSGTLPLLCCTTACIRTLQRRQCLNDPCRKTPHLGLCLQYAYMQKHSRE